ncbi:hypothetical protein DFA_11451 [Cavenderia fasciculata]|uniref:F-box domain-containing protein n=1 Tax=Cavenderia fasciculata TaxID=261658 RepID=F4QD09_CACFS|nr:uncharacterized protein DFA_11451 [Cavenderia fasciculata]EGG13690.1 hypothetical protein DFA_11451 [Cavenderia fasciculata]|eukprot:XP_004350394.1 hypothetical protein DFA_11451 [Cavenderia fasciculata]
MITSIIPLIIQKEIIKYYYFTDEAHQLALVCKQWFSIVSLTLSCIKSAEIRQDFDSTLVKMMIGNLSNQYSIIKQLRSVTLVTSINTEITQDLLEGYMRAFRENKSLTTLKLNYQFFFSSIISTNILSIVLNEKQELQERIKDAFSLNTTLDFFYYDITDKGGDLYPEFTCLKKDR